MCYTVQNLICVHHQLLLLLLRPGFLSHPVHIKEKEAPYLARRTREPAFEL